MPALPSSMMVFAALLCVTASAGDITVTGTVFDGTTTVSERWSVTDGRVLITQGNIGCIVDAETGRMVMFDTSRGTYFETSVDELAAYSDRVVPKSKLIRKIMRGTFADLKVERAKGRRTIAGYECELYEEEVGAATYRVWATTALTPPASFYAAMGRAYAATSPVGDPISPIYAALAKLGAMPLATNLTAMKVSLVDSLSAAMATIERSVGQPVPPPGVPTKEASLTFSEVTAIELESIPATRFDLPQGLRRLDSPYAVPVKK